MDEKSKKCRAGRKICQQLEKCIKEGDISLSLLKIVFDAKEKVALLCASSLNMSMLKDDDLVHVQMQISGQILKLDNLAKDYGQKLQLLSFAIGYAIKLSNDVYPVNGTETVIKTINDLYGTWGTTIRAHELQADTFWGALLPLLSPARALLPLMNSMSFMTVAKNALKELRINSTVNEDGNEVYEVSDFSSLMTFLATKAIDELRAKWNHVLNNPGSQSLETMIALLGALKDENILNQELQLLAKYLGQPFSPVVKTYLQNFVKYPKVVEQVQHITDILQIFGQADPSNEVMRTLSQFQAILGKIRKLTLEQMHHSMQEVEETISCFSGDDIDSVIKELSRSRELVGFIEEIVDEDIRFLIDAVDEYSDQFVSESSVSDLIDVHGFLAPFIRKKNQEKFDPQDFLEMLKTSCTGHRDIADKMKQCSLHVNSFRGLYTSIANRGEVTKEIIHNCLHNGDYVVSQNAGKCETMMTYVLPDSGEEKRRIYSLQDLHDLRSRAHLIVTSRKNTVKIAFNHPDEGKEDIDFDDFINQINLLTEISTLLSKLRSSGYIKYQNYWLRMKTTDDLQTNKETLQNDLENWENILKKARENFYFLNYYNSDQICMLYNFLVNESDVACNDVLSLIHFIDPTISEQQLQQYKQGQKLRKLDSKNNANSLVLTVGEALQIIFTNWQSVIRPISNDGQSQSNSRLEATVSPGEIFVAILEPGSPLTANVILELYKNTSNAFPEPYQIVFCSTETTWEELHLLLERCFTHSQNTCHESLFCIANVELLPNELQFKLVDAIKDKQISQESSGVFKESSDYKLALICRGGDHHHVVEQFTHYSHHITGVSDFALGHHLKSSWPDVKIITSTLPGLGKTEQIKCQAAKKNMNVVPFPISGPLEQSKLIKRLKELKVTKYHCLHLDIGEVSDPLLLDTFLFQLIVTGMVSAGTQFYHLPTTHIYIEIANTLKDWLRESLVVLKYFTRIHLEWKNYKDFVVSTKITSNTQVVCQYLDIYDQDRIDWTEVVFSGPEKSKPLPAHRCQELLAKYFSLDTYTNFTTLRTFLTVLADQLLKFSKSAFFKIDSLDAMLGEDAQDVRKNLFKALLQVSKGFARRAITASPSRRTRNLSEKESARALDEAMRTTTRSAEDMVERVKGMIKWEDSNHLLVVFHGLNSQAITAVYRNKDLVPSNIEKLLESQVVGENKELEDFSNFTQEQLQEKLKKIVGMKQSETKNLSSQYALTPDNILKMILIILRVRVNIPVIIMGETGCGKTSLVRYLANTCGVQFCTFNVHAGRSEEDIIKFIEEKEINITEQMWIFLDEINTCDHLGLISDIMCHHSLLGRPLSKKLVFLAACNPYKKRPAEHIETAGLEGKNITDEYSKLVYRVHPLPEAMTDYVWDYGSLAPKDERDYIKRMVKGLPAQYDDMLVDLLTASQDFIRNAEKNPFCVSLRDVHRCIRLIGWFQDMMKKRQELFGMNYGYSSDFQNYLMSEEYNDDPMIKSIVLSLAHCYFSRLQTSELRKNYRHQMITVFWRNEIMMTCDGNMDTFASIVHMEEEDYLNRMELPSDIAKNAALRENVFVMLVCILNRIPIFVVGKPGCSKSLSIQLIRSNLRGQDSQDPLFKQLPQLYVVSYQGSESSTSAGIIKVFEKAQKYTSSNKDILPVVLLDEVGLAENSKYNPLKVLHSLLEPAKGEQSDVAVVGISNWSLDAAKMNRAIHLSRPEPTVEDLYETGKSLHYADSEDNNERLGKNELRCLAEAYFEYKANASQANFHGLRDYYSLIKSLKGCKNFQQVNLSLQRNFGGLPGEVTNIQKIFLDKLQKIMISSTQDIIPVTKLIEENLTDRLARHLMLITSGDSAIGILKQTLDQLGKETITIYGSHFEEDLSEDYNYRILSRIILCMERDCILILRDLQRIYGSLYDMLNQNYAVVGNRKNCRVALGAYSNPMCQVNDGFRCIVLIDQHKVHDTDRPFLNRFEKQVLRFSDVLTEEKQNVIIELHGWVQEMTTAEGFGSQFKEKDTFIGFHEDTLPSLVLSHSYDADSSRDELLMKCKNDLMWIASPDGVLRTQKCNLLKENAEEVQKFTDEYLKKPLHQGFASFMEHVVPNHEKSSFFASDEIGSKIVILTFSNIHTDIRECLGHKLKCQVERLSAYKSEKQLAERIDEFWKKPEKELLVLQCKPELDGRHLLLARSIIEEKRNSFKHFLSKMDPQGCKHVCIIVHVQRGGNTEGVPWQFSFLCGWRQVFLDVLEAPAVPLNKIIGKSLQELLTSSVWPICRMAQNDLLWCFTCIKYTERQQRLDFILRIAKNFFQSKEISQVLERLILRSIELNGSEQEQETHAHENWHVQVACDRQLLVNSSTLHCAMDQFVSRLVRNPLAKIVYFLEKENAWPPHLVVDSNETRLTKLEDLWCQFIMNNAILRISNIPEPLGAETYVLDSTNLNLCLPFSQIIMKNVEKSVRDVFLDDDATLAENEDNLDDNSQLKQTVRQQQLKRFSKMIINLVPELLSVTSDCYDLYMKDIFDMITADFSPMLSRAQRAYVLKAMFASEVKQNLPANDMPEFFTLLHTFVWLHREEILDLLRMVECCQPFLPLEVLLNVMSDVFDSLNEIIFVKCHETSEGFDNEFWRIEETATNDTDNSHETSTNPRRDAHEFEFEPSKTMISDFEREWEKPSKDLRENHDEIGYKEATDEETEHDDSQRFGDILVTAYCEEMFPSPETVEKNGGLELWIRNANLLLSLAFKISEQSPAFHYLRLCLDFSRIIITSAALSTSLSSLYIFNEIGTALRPEYLDHDQSFEKITNQIIKPLEEDMKDHADKQEALQKFSALFYGRCIDTNVDTSSVRPIVEQVLSLERPELVMMMNQVVLRLLLVEKDESPNIFTDLIINPNVIENFPCLQNIDEVFKDRFLSDLIHHDSYPAVMICDLIYSLLNFDDHFKFNDINNPECQILMIARSANLLLSENSEDGCGLSVLSSIAFLRGFFKMLADFIAEKPTALKEDSPYNHVMTEVVSLLKDSKLSLQVFFLKQLYERASLFDLQKLLSQSNILSPITELWRDEKTPEKAVFTPAFRFPEYEKVKAAFWKLISKDDSCMHEFLTECSSSPNHAFALLGILINMIYLKRASRKLTDVEERLVDWFVGKVSSFPVLFRELLLRIIGRRDFHCPQLQLSIESSVEEVEIALLVLHIACVVATGGESRKLPIYRYFTNPDQFKLPGVLAHSKGEMHSVFEYQSSIKNVVCVTCGCGLRLAFKGKINKKVCPHCYEVLNNEAKSSKSLELVATLPLSANKNSNPQWDLCAGNMGPGVHCALHFIVYSSYYAGIALGTSSEQKLTVALNLLCRRDVESDSTIPANFCFKKMESDLSCLMKILSCNKTTAIQTMHLVVEKSSDLIRGDNLLEDNDCLTPTMRREWESTFSQLTETVFLNVRETSKEVKGMMKLQQLEENDEITLECRILELENYPEKPKEQNQQLKRLFRMTKQPCFDDFRSAFLYSPKDVKKKHTFLTLFLARFDQLQMIGHLHHLLKWSRLISSALTQRISRKDAQSRSINDFISGYLLELERGRKETENLKKLFDMFKEAWNEMRPLVNETLKDKETMPRLRETDAIAYCLTESECGCYLETAIKILVCYQNSVLDAAISLSSRQQFALSFLEKQNCSGVVCTSVQNVKEKEIISFHWSDDLFQHAQNNLVYGKGQEIAYDFERIEMKLAKKIVFGKCYLTETLNKFIFANELFHSCGPLLTEIRSLVTQSPSLPDEVLKGVSALKERRIKDAHDLLQRIEVLIFLIIQKLKNPNVDMTLEVFIEQLPMLTSSFPVTLLPEPRSSLKIKHIAALYEALEDVLADGAIEGLADKFREELPSYLKRTVGDMGEKDIEQLKPQNFLKALRRFVFRYLSSERCLTDESTTLQSYLKEPSLWSPLKPPNIDLIPQDITLNYIHSVLKYLEEVEKVRTNFFVRAFKSLL